MDVLYSFDDHIDVSFFIPMFNIHIDEKELLLVVLKVDDLCCVCCMLIAQFWF